MQQVDYPTLNKCEGTKYYDALVDILGKIKREVPNDRALKRYMRGQGWLDKDTFDQLAELIDIKVREDKPVELGPWAKAWIDTNDADKRRADLFLRLANTNEILVKYVFDAVQERLYSTSELYRMLTSYVYPGKRVDLPQFKNWLNWIQATDRIRILGIRWAPGRKFEDSLTYVGSIDVDEILEEEAEDELFSGEDGDDGEGAPPAAAPAAEEREDEGTVSDWEPPEDDDAWEDEPRPAPSPAARAPFGPGPSSGGGGGGGHDLGGGSSWGGSAASASAGVAPAVSGDAIAALTAALGQLGGRSGRGEVIEARLLQPAPHLSALAAGVPLERVREAMLAEPRGRGSWVEGLEPGEEVLAENVRALLDWWSGVEDRPSWRADRFGLMPFGESGWIEGSRSRFLFRLACLAVALLRGGAEGEVEFAVLDGAGFYAALFDEAASVERLLDELFEQGLGGRPELFQHLHLYLMLARSLRGAESFAASLPDLDAEDVYAGLWQRLAAFRLDLEVLWIVRELSMFGILRQPELREARVVPSADARRAAFHLGLLDTSRADTLPALLAASRRLTPLLGLDVETPLRVFWARYGAAPPARFWSR